LPEDLLENYQVGEIIGEGNFATVRDCVDINTGIKFALKIIDLRKCKGKVLEIISNFECFYMLACF
jgi:doublecortin-like kinase 1/2